MFSGINVVNLIFKSLMAFVMLLILGFFCFIGWRVFHLSGQEWSSPTPATYYHGRDCR